MKKLLISLGVVAMMFFAQAADVNAKTCDQQAEAHCEDTNNWTMPDKCCSNVVCNNTSAADKATICNKYCKLGTAIESDCNQEND